MFQKQQREAIGGDVDSASETDMSLETLPHNRSGMGDLSSCEESEDDNDLKIQVDDDSIIPIPDNYSINLDPQDAQTTSARMPSTGSKAIIYSSRGLMACSPLYNSSRYFTIIDAATKIFKERLTQWMKIYLGSGCVAANSALSSYGFYNLIALEKAGKLRRDSILLFLALSPAMSDDFSAYVGDNPLQNSEEIPLVILKYFSVTTFMLAAWALNYVSMLRLDARLSTDKETLHLIDQLKSLSYHLMGRESEDLREKEEIIRKAIREAVNLDNKMDFDVSKDSIQNLISRLDIAEKKNVMNEICKIIPLWNDNADWKFMTTYHYKLAPILQFVLRYPYRFIAMAVSVLSAITTFIGPYALTSKLWNYFFPDSNNDYIASAIGAIWGLFPPPVKSVVYFLLWTSFLFMLFHTGDTLRNICYRFNQRPLLTAAVVSIFIAILLWEPASGLGFYDTVEAFVQFIFGFGQYLSEVITGIDVESLGDAIPSYLQIIRQVWDFIGVGNGCVINNAAILIMLAVAWGHIQGKFFPVSNQLSDFFNGQANSIAMDAIPQETFAARIGASVCGSDVHLDETLPLIRPSSASTNSSRTWCGFFCDTISSTVRAIPSCLGTMVDSVIYCPTLPC